MTYKLCKILSNKGKLTAEMLDVYLAAERITADQYMELITLIKESEEKYKEIPEGTPLPEIKNEIEKNESEV